MSFAGIALVAVRESLEAFLILGILIGMLRKAGRPDLRKHAIYGSLLGVAASVALGAIFDAAVGGLDKKDMDLFEAAASFLAVGVLSYMAIWMYKHTRELIGTMHRKTKEALAFEKPNVILGVAFLAIFREGAELVVFSLANIPTDGVRVILLASLVGIAVSAVLSWLVFAGMLRMKIESFMTATSVLLIVMSAGMLVYGLHELSETRIGGALGDVPEAFDLSAVLPSSGFDAAHGSFTQYVGAFLNSAFGYRSDPTWVEFGAWLAYLVVMGAWFWRVVVHHRREPDAPAAVQE